jgi:hypothetical protein
LTGFTSQSTTFDAIYLTINDMQRDLPRHWPCLTREFSGFRLAVAAFNGIRLALRKCQSTYWSELCFFNQIVFHRTSQGHWARLGQLTSVSAPLQFEPQLNKSAIAGRNQSTHLVRLILLASRVFLARSLNGSHLRESGFQDCLLQSICMTSSVEILCTAVVRRTKETELSHSRSRKSRD